MSQWVSVGVGPFRFGTSIDTRAAQYERSEAASRRPWVCLGARDYFVSWLGFTPTLVPGSTGTRLDNIGIHQSGPEKGREGWLRKPTEEATYYASGQQLAYKALTEELALNDNDFRKTALKCANVLFTLGALSVEDRELCRDRIDAIVPKPRSRALDFFDRW